MSLNKITSRQIFDSRGNPTIEVTAHTSLGSFAACVPSGASTGVHEALELRDGGAKWGGKGVMKACENVRTLGEELVKKGIKVTEQEKIDKLLCELDGTKNKGKLLTK